MISFADRAGLFPAIATCLALALPAAADGAFLWQAGEPLDGKDWYISDFEQQNFRTAWSRDFVKGGADGALELRLAPSRGASAKPFIGAEVQRKPKVHYGRYEVVMQAARGEGVISSFFTYTGPYFGDPHDEIDFEFLGRDTTKVWLNRYVDGKEMPGQWIDLGFDSAEAPHLYVFEWSPEEIVWYIDGQERLRLPASEKVLPSHVSKLYINIWAGGEAHRDWAGVAPDDMTATARYHCLSFRPAGTDTPQCSDSWPRE